MRRSCKVPMDWQKKGNCAWKKKDDWLKKKNNKSTEERTQLKGYASVQECVRRVQGQCKASPILQAPNLAEPACEDERHTFEHMGVCKVILCLTKLNWLPRNPLKSKESTIMRPSPLPPSLSHCHTNCFAFVTSITDGEWDRCDILSRGDTFIIFNLGTCVVLFDTS